MSHRLFCELKRDIFGTNSPRSLGSLSVLGPLLFIIFINDLPEILKHLVKLFADDEKLIATITEEELRANQFQKDVKSQEKWCDEWSICLNV